MLDSNYFVALIKICCFNSLRNRVIPFKIWEIFNFLILGGFPLLTKGLAANDCEKCFHIIGRARPVYHLGILESVYIKTMDPILCRQKKFVYPLFQKLIVCLIRAKVCCFSRVSHYKNYTHLFWLVCFDVLPLCKTIRLVSFFFCYTWFINVMY